MIRLQGVVGEFQVPEHQDAKLEKYQFQWLYTNGLLGIIFSLGLLYTALKSRRARSWWYGTGLSSKQIHSIRLFSDLVYKINSHKWLLNVVQGCLEASLQIMGYL